MTTETTTMPLLNPAAFPGVEEVRIEVDAISDLISNLTGPMHEIVRRAAAVQVRCDEMRHNATALLEELQVQEGHEADLRDAVGAIVDAFTGASDLWMLLHTAANIIHPESVFSTKGEEVSE